MQTDRQDADGGAHLTYFDVRTQASFRWDGASDVVEVGIGGYGEPTDHTIPPPMQTFQEMLRKGIEVFADTCKHHAWSLPTYDGGPFTDEADR